MMMIFTYFSGILSGIRPVEIHQGNSKKIPVEISPKIQKIYQGLILFFFQKFLKGSF